MVITGVNFVTNDVFDAAGVRSLSYFFAENSDHRALFLQRIILNLQNTNA